MIDTICGAPSIVIKAGYIRVKGIDCVVILLLKDGYVFAVDFSRLQKINSFDTTINVESS